MQLQGTGSGGTSLQGGTGVQQAAPQQSPAINVQPAGGYTDYSPPVYTAPVSQPAALPVYYYSADGVAFTDPGAAQARTSAINSRDSGVNVIKSGESQNFSDAATTLTNQVNPFINTVTQGQQAIDQSRENSDLNRLSSIHDLLDQIRQGIQSFGINLANRNASDSGAAEAGAKAYAREGNKGEAQIEQAHAMDLRDINTKQDNFNTNNAETARQLHQSVSDNVTRITNDTQMRLEQLNADAAYAGLSPLDTAGLRAQIISEGQAKLQAIDQDFTNRMSAIAPESTDAAEANAYKLFTSGAPAPGGYAFSIASPSWSGAPISQISSLPIFTGNKNQNPSNSVA